jgi:cation diffusion facilitator family transporter
MKHCCEDKCTELVKLRTNQARTLKIVLAINAAMFFIEAYSGIIGKSTALLADSLDMFGDATVYAFSLYVIDRGKSWRARAALLKGVIMAAFGLGVLAQVVHQATSGVVPVGETMGLVAFLALAANTVCLTLLYRHRTDDINMRSTWLCSRNDLIANVSVIAAAIGVLKTGNVWPDLIVGTIIALLFLSSAAGVLKESLSELKEVQV